MLRDDPPPGQEAQLDYGHLGSWTDPQSGARRRVWAFIMVLAFSRHLFCYPVLRMTQREFLAAHVAAFAFFDGAPQRLVPDNLGSGVLKADLYDPRLNRGYAELLPPLRLPRRPGPPGAPQGQAARRAHGALRARQLLQWPPVH